MRLRLLPRQKLIFHSAWLVRVLSDSRSGHRCRDCGSRMFVKPESGSCPVCRGRRRRREEKIGEVVHEQAASALHDWSSGS
jgi:hypothetical protein